MPHLFFHVRFDHHSRSRDELGLDFPDVETACAEAVRAAKDLRDEFVAQGQNPRDYPLRSRMSPASWFSARRSPSFSMLKPGRRSLPYNRVVGMARCAPEFGAEH
jgi:hypothetical protein